MQKRISYYDVDWDRRSGSGGLWLTFDDRSRIELRPLALEELALLCNVLRAEKPVYYDPESERLSTQRDPVQDRGS
jgi:hypothetical protein